MAQSKRLNVTVEEPMYNRWKEAVEEEQIAASLAELVRTSVNRHIKGTLEYTDQQPESAAPDKVIGYLQRMDGTLSDVEERLERVESEVRTSSEADGADLQKVAFELLPVEALPDDAKCEAVEASDAVTAEHIAKRIDASEGEVLEALVALKPRDPEVCSADCGGTIYWWREVQ